MGRLFWKFFFAFWLALLITGITVATVVRLHNNAASLPTDTQIDLGAGDFVSVAADIFHNSDEQALRDFLQKLQQMPFPSVYAVDDDNKELLQRSLTTAQIQHARDLYQQGHQQAIQSISDAQGHHLLLFAPLQPRPDFGNPNDVLAPLKDSFNLNTPPRPDTDFRGPPPGDRPPFGEPPDFSMHPPPMMDETHPPAPPQPLPAIFWIGSGLVAALLFSIVLAWYFTKPIRLLRQAFASVAAGDLQTRIGTNMGRRHDELAELGRNFDDMTTQIQNLVTAQQRLLHDVSHELRSPLARMQAAIGLAQQQPEKTAITLERIERDSQRISDLVGELLVLSRIETGVANNTSEVIDLNHLLNEIVDDARFEATNKQVKIICHSQQELLLDAQEELLRRAIENVLRNAVRFTPPQGHVQLDMRVDNDQQQVIITIEDEGPGVTEQNLSAIFQPFFRGDYGKARNDSIGLGLTIAQRAVHSHGGVIRAQNRPKGGLHVEIVLPLKK